VILDGPAGRSRDAAAELVSGFAGNSCAQLSTRGHTIRPAAPRVHDDRGPESFDLSGCCAGDLPCVITPLCHPELDLGLIVVGGLQ
jgi:hypothetical protein